VDRQSTDITHLLADGREPPKRCEPDAAGWVPDGPCVAYRPDGSLLLEITYVRGVAHGPYRDFWPDGRVAAEGQYADGLQEGEWRFHDTIPGKPLKVLQFIAGREVVDWDAFFGRTQPLG
jgi:antitoxin component YwqK of YwqJK toxin-antitoxin module